MKKSILALLLAVLMVASLLPTAAMADGEAVAKIGEDEFNTLAEAITAAGEGDEIVRTNSGSSLLTESDGRILYDLRNLSLTSGGDYTIEVTVTFDGDEDSNTYKLTGSEDFTIR